jgi:hypothetical protein
VPLYPDTRHQMGTLSTELAAHVARISGRPRVYADANIPSGAVVFMRHRLNWDVLFVVEHDDLRRAPDLEHYRRARALGRTLVTLDRDYCSDRRFPPAESGGVLVFSVPDERALRTLLARVDREVFRSAAADGDDPRPPLAGRKLLVHPDWAGDEAGEAARILRTDE